MPFEISFRDVMSWLMERLFNEEVTQLKYFKTTHDNFSALVLNSENVDVAIDHILEVLAKLIGNPVAAFNRQLNCIGASDGRTGRLRSKGGKTYQPDIYSNYEYLIQKSGTGTKTSISSSQAESQGTAVSCDHGTEPAPRRDGLHRCGKRDLGPAV